MQIFIVKIFFILIEMHTLDKVEDPTCYHSEVIGVWKIFYSISLMLLGPQMLLGTSSH